MNNVQRQQALVDGSKRLGMALGFAFLEVNGYPDASAAVDDLAFAEHFLELIAAGSPRRSSLTCFGPP